MNFIQKEISLARPRGFHLITAEVERAIPEIRTLRVGQLQVFIKHTSAGLTINENADPTVRTDFESHFNKMVPENAPYYMHDTEGPDDMPAHIKSSLLGSSVTIPITDGKLNLGTWQGIYLCEHRDHGGNRKIVLTAYGIQ
ncbi:MAG TPA: secondary thiamine-phosphate synthase enzyme YjbQ [Chryseosolibacter sp.]|nr:secondary thiamine-phosphate synthase enzyme YjbQ [Chryseosolibacter sp.]